MDVSEMPNSLAICAIGLPLVCANRTASRLNSAVKVRGAFFILVHPLSGSSRSQIFPYSMKPGEVQFMPNHHLVVHPLTDCGTIQASQKRGAQCQRFSKFER